MDILIIMCVGIAIGRMFVSPKFKQITEKIQVTCTVLLIFTLGVRLGQRENFIEELSTLGLDSFIYFIVPTALSVVGTYLVAKLLLGKKEGA